MTANLPATEPLRWCLALIAFGLNPESNERRHLSILISFGQVLEIGNTSEAYDELFRYFKFHDPFHETEDRLMQTLAYIDVKKTLPITSRTGSHDYRAG